MNNHTKTPRVHHADRVTRRPGTLRLLTERDRDILDVLSHRLRVLSLPQIARTWWPKSTHGVADADRRVSVLETAGLLVSRGYMVHPELELTAPLASWRPGLSPPRFPAIAHAAARRWNEPIQTTRLVAVTLAAARALGGHGGRLPRTSEASHDMHLAAVYLWMRYRLPTRTDSWRAEASLYERRRPSSTGKIPDAMVRDGHSRTAIEMVGSYPPEKLRAFHAYCAEHKLGYELW